MENNKQQQLIDLLKTCKTDENGHLYINLKFYIDYGNWFLTTLKPKPKRDMVEMYWNDEDKFQFTICHLIAGSYQSVTHDFTSISTVCVELLSGRYDYVNVKEFQNKFGKIK